MTYFVNKSDRNKKHGFKSTLIWFTGLSGSGKSTLANEIETKLFEMGYLTFVLDGDKIRTGISKDLDYSDIDRSENIRRAGEIGKLFVEAGIIVIAAFISPFNKDRAMVRNMLEDGEFIEVYVKCAFEVCENRDVKGLYKKAKRGLIENFTGKDSRYEEPVEAEIVVETDQLSIDASTEKILQFILPKIKLK